MATSRTAEAAPTISQSQTWPPKQGQWTYEDWLRLPDDGFRYEVLDGVLHMTLPPTIAHQRSLFRLALAIGNFVAQHQRGEVFIAPCGVQLPGQPVPVQPDILFVSTARHDIVGQEYIEGAPDLVVEVLSPSNWLYDRSEKFRAYRDAGVGEYWIVDPRADTLEVFVHEAEASDYVLLNKFKMGDVVTLHVLSGFEVAVDEVLGN
jgi:Uma2 family endonuclease